MTVKSLENILKRDFVLFKRLWKESQNGARRPGSDTKFMIKKKEKRKINIHH